jgi:hypothetical protein
VKSTYTGDIGTVTIPLAFDGFITLVIGEAADDGTQGAGSSCINIAGASGHSGSQATVETTRTGGTDGFPPVQLVIGDGNTLTIVSGSVGLLQPSSLGQVNFYEGRFTIDATNTVNTIYQTGGDVVTRSAISTLDPEGRELRRRGMRLR